MVWEYKAVDPPKRGTVNPQDLIASFFINFPEFVVSTKEGKPLILEVGGKPNYVGFKYFFEASENGETQFRLAVT